MEHQWSAFLMRMADIIHALCVMQLVIWMTPDPHLLEPQQGFVLLMTLISVAWIYPHLGLYQTWRGGSKVLELSLAAMGWTLATLLIYVVITLAFPATILTVQSGFIWYGVGLCSLLLYKGLLRSFLNYYRAKGHNPRHIVVMGEGEVVDNVIKHLQQAPWAGFRIVGTFGQTATDGYPYLGQDTDMDAYFADGMPSGIDEVWCAMPMAQEERIKRAMVALRNVTHTIRYVPDIFGFQLVNHSTAEIAGLSLFNVSMSPMQGTNRVLKRVEDIVLSSLILLLIWPVLMCVAILVKCSSPGPVFYKQQRVSWNGQVFDMLKFRSMAVDNEAESVQWGGAKNKQVTRIGQFIRATSLDELPQFINVLKGDMSIVGPRPERPMFVDQFKNDIPGYMQKHLVKAGITGWAQINGWRGDTDLHERIKHDLHYVSNWSVWFDIKIIIKTCFKLSHNAE